MIYIFKFYVNHPITSSHIIKLLEKQGAEIVGVSVLGYNQTKRTKSLADNYVVKGILEYTDERERDLNARLDADL